MERKKERREKKPNFIMQKKNVEIFLTRNDDNYVIKWLIDDWLANNDD